MNTPRQTPIGATSRNTKRRANEERQSDERGQPRQDEEPLDEDDACEDVADEAHRSQGLHDGPESSDPTPVASNNAASTIESA